MGYLFLVVAFVAGVGLLLGALFWLSGQLSGILAGNGWPASGPSDIPSILRAWTGEPARPAEAWPDSAGADIGPGWLVYALFTAMLGGMGWLCVKLFWFGENWRRRREPRYTRLGFASRREIQQLLGADAVRAKAKSVRPSLRGRKDVEPRDVGFYLGRDRRSREELYASAEDVFIVLAPPRQGKDVHFCAPYTIDAPGACIVTSTRADAFTNTYGMRAAVGKVLVFDPNGLTNWPEKFRWSPVAGAENPRIAASRSTAFMTGAGLTIEGKSAYFNSAAMMILRIYLHAAAVGRRTINDIIRWTNQPTNPEPIRLLREAEAVGAGASGWAATLESTAHSHPEHVGAIWATLVQAVACFADPAVLEACSPEADEVLDMEEFLRGRNTLYILGKEAKTGSVAAVVTAMLEDMFDQARKIASRMPGSRMDPPLTVELNEAAHIAPLPNLPAYMGDSGGFSIALHVYLQSLSQARARWGEHEAMIMWDNAAIRVIMGGAGNVDDLEDISRLMGDVRSPGWSKTRFEGRRVLSPEEIRTLKFGTAVVVARAARPVEAVLTPWWKRADGDHIAAEKAKTEKLIVAYSDQADHNDPYRNFARYGSIKPPTP